MAAWLTALLPIAAAAVILVIPGYATVSILGFRGLPAWALAGPVSVPIIAMAAVISPLLGIPWGPIGPLLVTVAACVVAAVLKLTLRRPFTMSQIRAPRLRWPVVVALAIGGILIAAQFVVIVGDPRNISQTFDNIFHLNAARYVLDTHNASPLSVSRLTRTGATGITFYPSVWHGVVALTAESTGASIAVSSNAVMIAGGAVIWPASLLYLAVTLFKPTRAYVIAVGILSAAAPAFPILMIDYGVLYPYFLAICTLPAIIAGTLALLGLVDRRPAETYAPWLAVLIAAVPGLLLVHPSTFIAWMLLSGIAAIIAFIIYVRKRPDRWKMWTASVALLAAAVAAFLLWRALRPAIELNLWPPSETPGQALGEVLTMSMERAEIPVLLAILTIAGTIIAWRQRRLAARIAVGYLVILMALYVVTASMQWLWLRRAIAAAWYDNSPRLAALIPMLAVPIAAIAVEALWRWVVRRAPGAFGTPRTRAYGALITISCVALVLVTQLISIPNAVKQARSVYIPSASSPLLTPDEITMINHLPGLVPKDAVIAGNPGTGTAMVYALTGIRVLHPAVIIDMTPDISLIDQKADEATPGSAVCAALARERVDYILDFGMKQINGGTFSYPGFEHLKNSHSVSLVKQVGDTRLYKIVSCDS